MKKRIIGIDVARALAVFGMVIVHFKIVFGDTGNDWLKAFANLFDGKAAATFVVLAGIGLALMTNSALKNGDVQKLRTAKRRIAKRALFLFVVGLSYLWIWPADILHSYAFYMLVTLLLIARKSNEIPIWIVGAILLFPALLLFLNYETGWDFTTLEYVDFWTVKGFTRNLLFNGFNPVVPWVAFMLYGLWYGRKDLNDTAFVKKSFVIGLVSFIVIQLISYTLLQYSSGDEIQYNEDLKAFFGTDPMPPMPIFMLNGIAIATTVISGCILLARKYENNFIIKTLYKTGRLALTFYVAHVVIGIGFMEELGPKELGTYSIVFSVAYALVFSLVCMLFALVWTKYRKAGPLEWVMRKVSD
ncbi:DUF418 domain-containing protein [Flagellimonas nanhaiensis]|uniref:DUF418 domain-containing protein n=1 Tax=Flagellimonas nanhaiensis TaxID=2292706 RepID=A0A371JT97_9FLAO|nr:DUF418 domain-containing protein [Allomuricauda nanhaiensis]RDY61053.1 DUF418 domain-containing protein [Allomuricauda nanhaiensis]